MCVGSIPTRGAKMETHNRGKMKTKQKLADLESINQELERDIAFLERRVSELTGKILDLSKEPTLGDMFHKFKRHQPKYGGDVCFDFWPITDWFRLRVSKWNPGKYFQLCVGPLRLEFYEN